MGLEMKARAVLVVLGLLLGTASASAMNLGFSLGLGINFPTQQAVRDIYGTGIPYGARVWGGSRNFWVCVGADYLANRGLALSSGGERDEYPVRLTVTSIPIAIYHLTARGRFLYALGAGAYYSWYEEKWEGLDIVSKGRKLGWLAEFMGGYELNPTFSLFGSLSYAPIPTGKSSLVAYNIQLGGFKLSAGVLVFLN
jgi:hypothetical protein